VKRCGLGKECETGKSFVGRKSIGGGQWSSAGVSIQEMEKLIKDKRQQGIKDSILQEGASWAVVR